MTSSRARPRLAWLASIPVCLHLAGCAGVSTFEALPPELPARVELSSTPFHPQTEHQCGPAALATVLGAAGRSVEPRDLTAEVYLPGRQGSLQPELVAAARARGFLVYETGPALSDLLAEVATGRPALVLQQLGAGPWPAWHYAVVVGYDKDTERVLLRSGVEERLEMRAAMFEATWDRGGRWAVVLVEPGRLPARPDVTRYMRAAAALEFTAAPAAELAYHAALARWPDQALPRLALGNVAASSGAWRDAERWYGEALVRDPTQAAALNNRAEALARLGCRDSAARVLRDGTAHVAPDDPLRPVLQQTALELTAHGGSATGVEPASCSQFTVR